MNAKTPLIIASHNCQGLLDAAARLARGAAPVDAVELAVRRTEDNPDDHTVGYSGWPNLLGEVECDAAIMDGRTLRSGAVGALRGFRNPITVARRVMERLVHVLLVGEGAARFAEEMECEPREMLSPEARQAWQERLRDKLGLADPVQVRSVADLARLGRWAVDPEKAGGTVTCIARAADGNLAVGVSTSGFAWKYPGRLGDSPVIGAGSYADNRYGAAACTGFGEWTLSTSAARSVVLYMKTGLSVRQAVAEAMRDLHDVDIKMTGVVNVIAMDADGDHFGATTEGPTTNRQYLRATPDDPRPQTNPMASMPPPPDSRAARALAAPDD
ncbi:MAG: isoaspartyl peptidase/L-asparaginase [Phycisphaerae bacterium]|nr:isoaspartyl peptidase/L-asparaginase [Phycisphaerae bacterium]